MRSISFLLAVVCLGMSTSASAQLTMRCFQDDQLTTYALAQGRNAWSRKCGYISTAKEVFLNGEGEYQVYYGGCYSYPSVPVGSDCRFFVPASEAAACIGGLTKLGTCVTGCYTPTQRLSFDGQFQEISKAYDSRRPTVTAMKADATPENLGYGEQAIRAFIAGKTAEDVVVLVTADGRRIEVTSEHPMVTGDGTMVKAKTLKRGDKLLGADGKKVAIKNVTYSRFEGTIWNIQPTSHEKAANVLNVEGLLTGSVRFQNEWAADHYRLSLRDEANVDGL